MKFWIRSVDKTDSTQDHVFRLAKKSAPPGTVIVASEQTRGRGRLKRKWLSPKGGLYLSILLDKRNFKESDILLLTLRAGLATHDFAEHFGVSNSIKWPNDILVGDLKLAGLLAEARDEQIVLGVGININETPIETAASMSDKIGPDFDSVELTGTWLAFFEKRLERDDTVEKVNRFLHGRDQRAWHDGKEVVIKGVSPSGALVIESDGTKSEVISGEIRY